MSQLREIQQALAASLVRGAPGPARCDPEAVARAVRALEVKRRRAAGHLLPHLKRVLGDRWRTRFHQHAAGYAPDGMLYHVDDAWELAATAAGGGEPALRRAARDDLAALRRRYVRSRRRGVDRIRERGSLLDLVRGWLTGFPAR